MDEFVYKNLETTVMITTSYASVFMLAYAVVIPLFIVLIKNKNNTKSANATKEVKNEQQMV